MVDDFLHQRFSIIYVSASLVIFLFTTTKNNISRRVPRKACIFWAEFAELSELLHHCRKKRDLVSCSKKGLHILRQNLQNCQNCSIIVDRKDGSYSISETKVHPKQYVSYWEYVLKMWKPFRQLKIILVLRFTFVKEYPFSTILNRIEQ